MIRAALYARVSTTNGQSTENQLAQLRQVAERQGWQVVAEHVDDGISGSKSRAGRPALDAMLRAVTRREVDLVAAWSVDRLGRSLQDLIGMLEELRVSGCELYLHQQGLDTRTPAGRAMFQLLGVFAEFERALVVERVRAGMERAKRSGTKSGKPIGRPRVSDEKLSLIERAVRDGGTLGEIARQYRTSERVVLDVRRRVQESERLRLAADSA